ncbi:hypothetical protein FACS1894110_10750 [Spirochaetia bacterium]|nr:hypothetical protein FACS1894110_10750 [Spirochaetia bacterium]
MVIISAIPSIRFVVAYFAVLYIGAVAIPVDKNANKDAIIKMSEYFNSKVVFIENDVIEAINTYKLSELTNEFFNDPVQPEVLVGEDLANIFFTSATTGSPKGVMLTHKNILSQTLATIDITDVSSDVVWLIPIPLHHVAALRRLRAVLFCGGTVVLENGFSSLINIFGTIIKNRCTGITCTPSAMRILYEQTKNNISKLFGGLQAIVLDTMPIPLDMKQSLVKDLPLVNIYNVYGSTEAAGIIAINYSKRTDKIGSIGIPATGVKVKIVNNDNKEIKSSPENTGRLAIYGDMVMRGYWGEEKLTQESIVDGWLIMNDIAYIDDDGYIFLLGRVDDIIIIGGEKVSPFEIENKINSFESIKDSCCIAVEDPQGVLGQIPIAFITVHKDMSYSEKLLHDYLQQNLERHKIPRKIILVDEIPRNIMGKMLRRELIKAYQEN